MTNTHHKTLPESIASALPEASPPKEYNVHIFREMRLSFPGITANNPQAAAAIASKMESSEAEDIEDCDGEDMGALIDLVGDEDYTSSELLEFEPQRERRAAAEMLAALHDAEQEIVNMLQDLCDEPEEDISARRTLATIRKAIANAGISGDPESNAA